MKAPPVAGIAGKLPQAESRLRPATSIINWRCLRAKACDVTTVPDATTLAIARDRLDDLCFAIVAAKDQ